MAHYATKRFNYWEQLGVLLLCGGVGLIIGGLAQLLPLLSQLSDQKITSQNFAAQLQSIMEKAPVSAIRWMQFLATFFTFFLPAIVYAKFCHRKPWQHLGFNQQFNWKQLALALLVIPAAMPLVGALQELTTLFPWSKSMWESFKNAEISYNKQIALIAKMNNFGGYLITLVMIALLPALFEEVMFRGVIQNLLTRWLKKPVVAIVITAAIFSIAHGSILGFLSRFALGFVLGWLYYRSGNIWLNIAAHFINNAFAITSLYVNAKNDQHLPLWTGLTSIVAIILILKAFDDASKPLQQPGIELPMPLADNEINPANPFTPSTLH